MKSAFKGEQVKAVLSRWHDHFRVRLWVPTESRTVQTRAMAPEEQSD
ncbi:hypothetical protein MXAN_5301 [Myxococcus xanthus DK 1622]|uniref:Uncharacterized protein n=1 Tax=Myxococcus xanthus (strain DK1622) TaxID=246197 RepID=Q1D1M1_MYXXD|nr:MULTISPECIES: hypothetical protein [Myxococcus]ABF88051.1 hypothetical protein MXAN_5301 [Myxococcus xanthus DK 1622]NOJ53685.1 hypothetical protein [Myxococcus xanthus]QPM77775.1 hypothetical protein I5Q59_26190 [Myxococcus xanthus]QVW66843.1 hypothetical protein JTM82_31540 [Myxococcus xanthus DZ2]UEO07029.1 hypothetical protein K1515_11255 [Myxococcus xanthus DZ2]